MKTREIIFATMFVLMLVVATSSQRSVFAESSLLLTPISLESETGASPTNATGTMGNITSQASEYYPRGNASLQPPQVIFPTQEEIENYFLDKNVTAPTFIGNSSLGNVTNIQETSSNGTTYVVFQTKLNDTDRVFLAMVGGSESTRGASYSNPVELTPAQQGNISHLQIAADINGTFVVWQHYNSTTGLNSIFVSSSMDSGKTFRTFRASDININAFDPTIVGDGIISWKQLCEGILPGQPPLFCPLYYVRW
jgi:hypothetical protein